MDFIAALYASFITLPERPEIRELRYKKEFLNEFQ